MKKKIIVLGAAGLLGNTLFKYLIALNKYQVYGFVRRREDSKLFPKSFHNLLIFNSDINETKILSSKIKKLKPDYIVNCVGVVKQIIQKNNTHEAILYNSLLPHILYSIAKQNNAKLIHISTDCVFDGNIGNYSESDIPNAMDLYGKSKALGEITYKNSVTIRTSYIGHELKSPHGLLEWFLSQENKIKGYTNAYYNGLTTLELSIIIENYFFRKSKLNGLYNISSESISKFSLLSQIGKIYKKDILIMKEKSIQVDRTLNSLKFRKITGYRVKSWAKMLNEMYQFDKINIT